MRPQRFGRTPLVPRWVAPFLRSLHESRRWPWWSPRCADNVGSGSNWLGDLHRRAVRTRHSATATDRSGTGATLNASAPPRIGAVTGSRRVPPNRRTSTHARAQKCSSVSCPASKGLVLQAFNRWKPQAGFWRDICRCMTGTSGHAGDRDRTKLSAESSSAANLKNYRRSQ